MSMRLGRLPPSGSAALAPRLTMFARAPLPMPPAKVDYVTGVPWRMFCNDVLGCCTISAWANGVVQRTSLAWNTPLVMPDDVVKQIYGQLSGWTPADPVSDRGLCETDVLSWFARVGVDLGRQAPEVTLWGSIGHDDLVAFRQAIWLFGHCYIGLMLPASARGQAVWDVPRAGAVGEGAPGSWGGHCVICAGYDENFVDCITWGGLQRASWAFIKAYMDEAYVTHSPGEWIGSQGLSPSHFDFLSLAAACAAFQAG